MRILMSANKDRVSACTGIYVDPALVQCFEQDCIATWSFPFFCRLDKSLGWIPNLNENAQNFLHRFYGHMRIPGVHTNLSVSAHCYMTVHVFDGVWQASNSMQLNEPHAYRKHSNIICCYCMQHSKKKKSYICT